jgi:hypothetical protein
LQKLWTCRNVGSTISDITLPIHLAKMCYISDTPPYVVNWIFKSNFPHYYQVQFTAHAVQKDTQYIYTHTHNFTYTRAFFNRCVQLHVARTHKKILPKLSAPHEELSGPALYCHSMLRSLDATWSQGVTASLNYLQASK